MISKILYIKANIKNEGESRTILGFFGINDIETIAIENVDVIGADLHSKIEDGIKKANLIAQKF